MSLGPATRERTDALLAEHRVVLFMKGGRQQLMCGFSVAATNAFNELLPDHHTVNVLKDPEIREGIKAYGDWPKIPQLSVEDELIGGSDIIRQFYISDELHGLFGAPLPDRAPPEITTTDAAAKAIRQGTANAQGVFLHLEIGPDHSVGFQLAPAGEHDILTHANGLVLHFDPASAQRAKGIVIDWVSTVQGEGLSLKFLGAREIVSLRVQQLQARLAAGDITLIDVRPARAVPRPPRCRRREFRKTKATKASPLCPRTPRWHSSAITASPAAAWPNASPRTASATHTTSRAAWSPGLPRLTQKRRGIEVARLQARRYT